MTAYGQPGSVYLIYQYIVNKEGQGTVEFTGRQMADYGGSWLEIGNGSWLTSQTTAATLHFYQRIA